MGLIDLDLDHSKNKNNIVRTSGWFDQVLRGRKSIFHFVLLLGFMVSAIVCLISALFLFFKSISPDKPTYVNDKGAVVFTMNEKEIYLWLFNTSEMFANSGIRVKKGDIIKIACSGRYNSAINLLVAAARDDKKLAYEWAGRYGVKNNDSLNLTVSPKDNFGAVLACIFPEGIDPLTKMDGDKYLFQDASMVNTIEYFSKRNGKKIKSDGVLTFVINDIPITDNTNFCSLEKNNDILEEEGFQKDNYGEIKKLYLRDGYNNAFFDDNLGEFLMVIEKRTSWMPSTIFHCSFSCMFIFGFLPWILVTLRKKAKIIFKLKECTKLGIIRKES